METMAFLGSSKGLGRAVAEQMDRVSKLSKALLLSRTVHLMESLGSNLQADTIIQEVDFSQEACLPLSFDLIKKHKPTRLFYFAGGGPYGPFGEKEWKDHQWALQVSFLTPARMLHGLINDPAFAFLEQVIFVGSQVADHRPDPLAASYACSKHALKGLIESVMGEAPPFDLRLFRPGYINTEMLPKNALPRQRGDRIAEPQDLARRFVEWALNENAPKCWSEPN
jgi:short-subunit dehydrogenase